MSRKDSNSGHWPVIVIVAVIAAILLFSLFTYQINSTEYGVVLRFGQPQLNRDTNPGIHPKWPFETIWRVENRIQCFDGNIGVLEEVFTRDKKTIIISVFIGWKVSDEKVVQFLERVKNLDKAEVELSTLLRSYRNSIIGKYSFSDLINIDPEKIKIKEIEKEMLDHVSRDALNLYGIDVRFLGVKHIGLPEAVTAKVFDRMNAEREMEAQRILAEGNTIATRLRAEADKESVQLFAEAENKAKRIRAQGDAEAAKSYAVFKQNPQLALFLRKLDSLKKTLSEKSVLILDTNTAPFDLLNSNALEGLENTNSTGQEQ